MRKLSKNFVNQIHHCDAIVGMKRLPDHCIHLTVTSPPYDGLRTFGGVGWNDNTFRPMADELWRITIPGGVVVWIVADTIVNGSETCTSIATSSTSRRSGSGFTTRWSWIERGHASPAKYGMAPHLSMRSFCPRASPVRSHCSRTVPTKRPVERRTSAEESLTGAFAPWADPNPLTRSVFAVRSGDIQQDGSYRRRTISPLSILP